jgi:hypothetical protein
MIRLYLWFCRVLFVAREPWVRWAPGLPCALFMREGHASDINSGVIRREMAKACLGCLKFKSRN